MASRPKANHKNWDSLKCFKNKQKKMFLCICVQKYQCNGDVVLQLALYSLLFSVMSMFRKKWPWQTTCSSRFGCGHLDILVCAEIFSKTKVSWAGLVLSKCTVNIVVHMALTELTYWGFTNVFEVFCRNCKGNPIYFCYALNNQKH